MALPTLTPEARAAALEKAAEARVRRSDIRRRLKNRETTIAAVIAEFEESGGEDTVLARTRVIDLLKSVPGLGPVRAAEAMDAAGIAPNRRLGGLGEHQRAELVSRFS